LQALFAIFIAAAYIASSTTIGQKMYTADAVKYYGGRRELAEALGITRQAVEQWGKLVALGCAYKLQVITKGDLMVDERKYKKAGK